MKWLVGLVLGALLATIAVTTVGHTLGAPAHGATVPRAVCEHHERSCGVFGGRDRHACLDDQLLAANQQSGL